MVGLRSKDSLVPPYKNNVMQSGLVFNIQRYSLHDGPGIRTTVFLKGCPMQCAWCHNPEGIAREPEILRNASRCIDCGECREVCPEKRATPLTDETWKEDELPRCIRCGACVEPCPTDARRLVGRSMTVAEVLRAIQRDRPFHEDSGGGATFSGGEPLMQPAFLLDLLAACRAQEINTAVDTSGYASREDLLAAARLADLFLYDIKTLDDSLHQRYTGVSNRLILENLQALGQVHGRIWIRVPLIANVNDDLASQVAIVRLAASIPGVRQVNLLAYHATGVAKYARLGKPHAGCDFVPPGESMHRAIAELQDFGVPVFAGG
jgi:pyruvate formate lyase activating enzyme